MSLYGKIVYKTFFYPISQFRKWKKIGFFNAFLMEWARRDMVKASGKLTWIYGHQEKGLTVTFLTGKKYWYQTAFCFYSLCKAAPDEVFHLEVIDDGSIDDKLAAKIKAQFPNSSLCSHQSLDQIMDTYLPVNLYPKLHFKRKTYPHIKKLTDVYVNQSGYKLVLDSDMLFFKKPVSLIEWLKKPDKFYYIYDKVNCYYYSAILMQQLTGMEIKEKINVGVIGLKAEAIDWVKIEHWIKELEKQEGSSYFLEQALSAMIIGSDNCIAGSPLQYIVYPNPQQINSMAGCMQHYVDLSKEYYFKIAWKKVLNN